MARVETVNVGETREILVGERPVSTAIFKSPVSGRVPVRGVNLEGDDQADRSVHGGPDKAVYAYASEDTAWWESLLGRPLGPGAFGENLTTSRLDLNDARIGERWAVGTAVLEVAQPRFPCFKLGLRMGDPHFVKRFARALRPGAYLRIAQEGDVGENDTIELVSRPTHDVTLELFARVFLFERERLPDLLRAPELPASWVKWIEERI